MRANEFLTESRPRTLYHGTLKSNLPSIMQKGLEPRVGDFTNHFYDQEEDELEELVFAAGKKDMQKALNAIIYLLKQQGIPSTPSNIIKYGAVVVIKDEYNEFEHRPKNDHNQWGEHPTQVEPGDFYSRDTVSAKYVLQNNQLKNLLRRQGFDAWQGTQHPKLQSSSAGVREAESAGVVAYHGTTDSITKFRPLTHFGTEKAARDRMDYKKNKNGKIYKVQLDIRNPFTVKDFAGNHYDRVYAFELRDKKKISQEEMEAITFLEDPAQLRAALLAKVKELGYDGFVYKNRYEDKGNISYVILDPSQVKVLEVIPVGDADEVNEEITNLRVYKNPSPKQLHRLTQRSAHKHMRGMYHNGGTYWWDANDAIHKQGSDYLGIPYDYLSQMEAAIDSISDNYRVGGDDGVPPNLLQKYDIENELVYETKLEETVEENFNNRKDILKFIDRAADRYGVEKLSGGNCGTFALALAQKLKDTGVSVSLGVLFSDSDDIDSPMDIIDTEADVYHVVIEHNNKYYDGTGIVSADTLLSLARDQYGDRAPGFFRDVHPFDPITQKLIRSETNWSMQPAQFYQALEENFADGKVKGKSRPGRVKRAGASCKGSVTDLRAKARKYSGERGKMYQWCLNMKSGKKK
jgi:hypothetical protein